MQQLIEAKSIKFVMNASVYVVKAKQLHSIQGLVESWKVFENPVETRGNVYMESGFQGCKSKLLTLD